MDYKSQNPPNSTDSDYVGCGFLASVVQRIFAFGSQGMKLSRDAQNLKGENSVKEERKSREESLSSIMQVATCLIMPTKIYKDFGSNLKPAKAFYVHEQTMSSCSSLISL